MALEGSPRAVLARFTLTGRLLPEVVECALVGGFGQQCSYVVGLIPLGGARDGASVHTLSAVVAASPPRSLCCWLASVDAFRRAAGLCCGPASSDLVQVAPVGPVGVSSVLHRWCRDLEVRCSQPKAFLKRSRLGPSEFLWQLRVVTVCIPFLVRGNRRLRCGSMRRWEARPPCPVTRPAWLLGDPEGRGRVVARRRAWPWL